MLIGVEARNVPAVGALVQERHEIGHQVEFTLAALAPAQIKRLHQVGELLAVEDHALKNGLDKGRQRFGRQIVVPGEVGDLPGLPCSLELLIAGADRGLVEAFALLERTDVFGDLLPLVEELGVGLDQPDELFAADLELLRVRIRIPGDQLHDVVIVDQGGGEENELEVELVDLGIGRLAIPTGPALLLFQPLGGFEIDAAEGAEVVLGEDLFDLSALLIGEVGVLVKLRLEALYLLEPVDEQGLRVVALQVIHLIRFGFEAVRFHEFAKIGHRLPEIVDDVRRLVDQPDLPRLVGLCAREHHYGVVDLVLLIAEVEDVAVGLGRVEHAVGAGKGLDQAVVPEILVDVERVEEPGVEAGEKHVDDDSDVDLLLALAGQVAVGELLILDALLDVLIVEVEIGDVVVRVVLPVVVGDDGLERGLLALGVMSVVLLLLGKILLNLPNVLVALSRRREDGGDL